MTDDEIFDKADQYGWMDDFGRWNFQPDRLVSFALALMQAEREACAKLVDPLDESLADEIRGEALSEKNVRVSDKWVNLTADDVWEVYKKHDSLQYMDFARAIEAKLKEKNGG